MAGGMVVFLEAEEEEKLIHFYQEKNGFKRFDTKEVKGRTEDAHMLVQLLKILQCIVTMSIGVSLSFMIDPDIIGLSYRYRCKGIM